MEEEDAPSHRPPTGSIAGDRHPANASASIFFLSGSGKGQLVAAIPFPTCEKSITPCAEVFSAEFQDGTLLNGDLLYDNPAFVAFGRNLVPPHSECLQGQDDFASAYQLKDFLELTEAFIDAGVSYLIVSGFPEHCFSEEACSALTCQGVDTHLAIPVIGIASGHEPKFADEPEIDIFFADVPCEEDEHMQVRIRRTLRQPQLDREDRVLDVLEERMASFRKRFKELDADGCRRLCSLAAHEHFQAGETVYSPGQVDHRCYVVLRGAVVLSVTNANGHLMQHLRRDIGVGGHFGELALQRDEPRKKFAVAAADGADVMVLARGAYQEVRRRLRFEEVKRLLETESAARSPAQLRALLVFLGDQPQAFEAPTQLAGKVDFFAELEDEVRLALASRLQLRRCSAGEQLSVRGTDNDRFNILLEGEVESQASTQRLTEGAVWGRTQVLNRTGKHSRSLRAATPVTLIELSRHDYIAVTLRREEEDVENRFSVSNAFLQLDTEDPEELARAFALFSVTKYEPGEIIASEGSRLECLWRRGGGGEGQDGQAAEVERGGVQLDVVARGRCVLRRRVELVKVSAEEMTRALAEAALGLQSSGQRRRRGVAAGAKEMALLELGRGECVSGPALFGGSHTWPCSVVASTPVELISLPLPEARALLGRDRLRALLAAARAHSCAMARTLSVLLRCQEEVCCLPASAQHVAELEALALPLARRAPRDRRRLREHLSALFPAAHLPEHAPPTRPTTAPPKTLPHPSSAARRPTTAGPTANAGKGGQGGAGQLGLLAGARRGREAAAVPVPPQRPSPSTKAGGRAGTALVRAMRQQSAAFHLPPRLSPDAHPRLHLLAQPNPRTRRLPASARLFPPAESDGVAAAAWCNSNLPKYRGSVYMLKGHRHAPGLHPYFAPWTVANGRPLHQPQMRLDDILFAQVQEARHN